MFNLTTSGIYNCANIIVILTSGFRVTAAHATASFTNNPSPARDATNRVINGIDFTVIQNPNASISNASIKEGDSGTKNLEFTVSLSSPAAQNVTVNYSTAGGSAQSNVDFQAVPNGTLTIPAAATTGKAIIPIIGDTLVEQDETFTVTLTGAQGATIVSNQATATGTIENDDFGGTLQFSAAEYSVAENGGKATITVRRTNGEASGVTVNYATSNGTAIANQDYTPASGTLTFGANEPSKTFDVSIINNSTPNEPDKTVNLRLSNPAGGGSPGALSTAVLKIIDDDRQVAVTVNTDPAGLSFTMDGEVHASQQTRNWTPGTPHTISVTSPQNGAAGTRYVFDRWDDGNRDNPRSLNAPTTATTYTAIFKTQYKLTTSVNPAGAGSVSANPSSANDWYDANQPVQLTATANSGYRFSNWTETGSNSNPLTVTMSAPITRTANFTQNAVPVTVQTNPAGRTFMVDNDPTVYTSPKTFDWLPDSQHKITAISPQDGTAGTRYVFDRWNDNGSSQAVRTITVPSSATTYTANFTTQYYLTVNANLTNAGTVNPQSGWHNAGATVQISASENQGFSFNNWTGTGAGHYDGAEKTRNIVINNPITQTANFSQNPANVQITVKTNPAGRSFTVGANTYNSEQTFSLAPGTTLQIGTTEMQPGATGTRFVFNGWSNGGAMSQTITVPSTNQTYTANFTTQHQLTVNANPTNGGTVSVNTPSADGWYNAAQTVQLTATANSGYSFNGWTGTVSPNSNPLTVTMSAPVTLTANFTQNPSNISVTVGTNPQGRSFTVDGTVYTSVQTFNWQPGSTHTISTNSEQSGSAGTRYLFSGWSDGGSISHTVAPTASTTYTANFTTQHQLTVSANPSAGGTVNPQSGSWFDSGQTVQITASPASGYRFDGWSGSGSGSYTGANNSQTITINSPVAQTANFSVIIARKAAFDFDGDKKTDVSFFRPMDGMWRLLQSQAGYKEVQFGSSLDKLAPADFDGDGKTDIAYFRESDGKWFVLQSSTQTALDLPAFGISGDVPVPGDWDGDGKADVAVYRDAPNPGGQSYFYFRGSLNNPNGNITYIPFGLKGDVPLTGDYDGDGKQDAVIFRPSVGEWWYYKSRDGGNRAYQFGSGSDKPAPADFTGDGKTDIAFWRPSTGEWFVLRSEDDSYYSGPFGKAGDVPVPGDYDGDGKADLAVWRASENRWYVYSSNSGYSYTQFNGAGEKPVPSAFLP